MYGGFADGFTSLQRVHKRVRDVFARVRESLRASSREFARVRESSRELAKDTRMDSQWSSARARPRAMSSAFFDAVMPGHSCSAMATTWGRLMEGLCFFRVCKRPVVYFFLASATSAYACRASIVTGQRTKAHAVIVCEENKISS